MNSNQLLARNPGVVLLQWLNNTPQNDIDVFNFKELDETKNIDQSLNNEECVLQCLPCQRTFKCISSLQRHCKVELHTQNENDFIRRNNENQIHVRKKIAVESGVTTINSALLSDPLQLFFGLPYILEIRPEEFDEIPIFICALPFCKFLGFASEISSHIRSPQQHSRGYFDVNGVSSTDESEGMITLLHEYDIESSDRKSVEFLCKRVVNTFDYQCASVGIYPISFHEFVERKVLKDFNESRRQKLYVNETPITSSREPSKSTGKSHSRLHSDSESSGKTQPSDLKEHLSNLKLHIYNIVSQEFQNSGRLNNSNLITSVVMRQLCTRYYQDEKIFYEKDLWNLSYSEVTSRVRCRVLNFLDFNEGDEKKI